MLGPFEDSEFGRDIPRPAKAGQAGQGAQYERNFLSGKPRPVGGELHFMGSTNEFGLSRQQGKAKKYLNPNGEMV